MNFIFNKSLYCLSIMGSSSTLWRVHISNIGLSLSKTKLLSCILSIVSGPIKK